MANVKCFQVYIGQRLHSRSQGPTFVYEQEGLITRNVPVKYESLISYGSSIFGNIGQSHKVKNLVNGNTSSQGMNM